MPIRFIVETHGRASLQRPCVSTHTSSSIMNRVHLNRKL